MKGLMKRTYSSTSAFQKPAAKSGGRGSQALAMTVQRSRNENRQDRKFKNCFSDRIERVLGLDPPKKGRSVQRTMGPRFRQRSGQRGRCGGGGSAWIGKNGGVISRGKWDAVIEKTKGPSIRRTKKKTRTPLGVRGEGGGDCYKKWGSGGYKNENSRGREPAGSGT